MYLATFQTAEITTSDHEGKEDHNTALIDASQGTGGLETNDINYIQISNDAIKYYAYTPSRYQYDLKIIRICRTSSSHSDRKLQFLCRVGRSWLDNNVYAIYVPYM